MTRNGSSCFGWLRTSSLSFSFPTLLWPQILHFLRRWGSLFSKKLFSITHPYWLWPLSFNRLELNTYCESKRAPGTVDANMTEQNLALILRCSQGFWWTDCNWIYEGSLLPTMWKSEDGKATLNISNYPATWITRLLKPSGLTSATKCNHLLYNDIMIRTTGHSVSFPALPALTALPYNWQHTSPLAMRVACMPPGNQKCVTSSLAPRQISTGH